MTNFSHSTRLTASLTTMGRYGILYNGRHDTETIIDSSRDRVSYGREGDHLCPHLALT